ncbi:MAG: formylglycine-generating enzyme family protein, partial [Planctomyces sp.]
RQGSASGIGSADERPQHKVHIPRFWMQSTAVTVEQYLLFDGNQKSRRLRDFDGFARQQTCPVIDVSWYDAVLFGIWVGGGCRLPRESEWEFACRAGTSTPFSFPVPVTVAEQDIGSMEGEGWAAIAPEHLNYVLCLDDRDCVEAVPPKRNLNVGLRQPNPWGLHEMHGSVWELCLDGYSE